jgi:hypothetical protein
VIRRGHALRRFAISNAPDTTLTLNAPDTTLTLDAHGTTLLIETSLYEATKRHSPSFIHSARARSFEGELSAGELEFITGGLSRSQDLVNDSRACVIVGYGGQTTAMYRGLARTAGIDVLWHANWGPWWTTPLLWIAASRGGLIRVNNPTVVSDVFRGSFAPCYGRAVFLHAKSH